MEARAVVFSGRCCSPGLPPSTRHRAAPGSWIFDKYKCLNTEGRAGNAMPGQFVQELHQLSPANNSHSSIIQHSACLCVGACQHWTAWSTFCWHGCTLCVSRVSIKRGSLHNDEKMIRSLQDVKVCCNVWMLCLPSHPLAEKAKHRAMGKFLEDSWSWSYFC